MVDDTGRLRLTQKQVDLARSLGVPLGSDTSRRQAAYLLSRAMTDVMDQEWHDEKAPLLTSMVRESGIRRGSIIFVPGEKSTGQHYAVWDLHVKNRAIFAKVSSLDRLSKFDVPLLKRNKNGEWVLRYVVVHTAPSGYVHFNAFSVDKTVKDHKRPALRKYLRDRIGEDSITHPEYGLFISLEKAKALQGQWIDACEREKEEKEKAREKARLDKKIAEEETAQPKQGVVKRQATTAVVPVKFPRIKGKRPTPQERAKVQAYLDYLKSRRPKAISRSGGNVESRICIHCKAKFVYKTDGAGVYECAQCYGKEFPTRKKRTKTKGASRKPLNLNDDSRVHLELIMVVVCEYYNVEQSEVCSRRDRRSENTKPREVFAYLGHYYGPLNSNQESVALTCSRGRGWVSQAQLRIARQLKHDTNLFAEIHEILCRLEERRHSWVEEG